MMFRVVEKLGKKTLASGVEVEFEMHYPYFFTTHELNEYANDGRTKEFDVETIRGDVIQSSHEEEGQAQRELSKST